MNHVDKKAREEEKKIKERGRETINISGGSFFNQLWLRSDLVSLEHKASLTTTIYNSTYDIYGLILSVLSLSYGSFKIYLCDTANS